MDKKFLLSLCGIGALIVIIVVLFGQINDLKNTIRIDKVNIAALNDTLKEYSLKNGKIVAEKQAFYSDLEGLKGVNRQLYDSIKYYEKALKIKTSTFQNIGINGQINTIFDSIQVNNEKINDTIVRINLEANEKDSLIKTNIKATLNVYHDSNSLMVLNSSLTSSTTIEGLSLNIITGYRKSGLFKPSLQYLSAITTNDTRFKISEVNSWINKDFEKKRYLSLKPGLFAGGFYDPIYRHFSLGVGFGLTVQFIK